MDYTRTSGFTLLELLLTIAFFSILSAIALPISREYYTHNAVIDASETLLSVLRQAQQYARASVGDESWGVYMTSGEFVLFQGTDYASRATVEDRIIGAPGSFFVSGCSEVVFEKGTGLPTQSELCVLSNNDGDSRRVSISDHGVITQE